MGVDAVLYRLVRAGPGRGRPSHIAAGVVADPDDVLLDLLKRVRGGGRTPLLDRVDPLGELVVAAEAAPQLLAELGCLAEVARAPAEVDQVRQLAQLTRRCLTSREVEIRFEGD
ncbi:hypothetical protein U2F26_07395 [Micromonospora sp. 4G57]|uniref:Uncharacterized protein n=1 Tax=Micromonospora sicca TaxID=2202420 RepID=A0A317DHX9_9ACTN|nr:MULTISPECIES: hypothetical protein [unclassified Micromonospora]MDZ5442554.1 hypothetical protein [Micromonospora sp. 4G57]MDZ5490694.1 hypothetical protein [Micromonospora sp. 4G53]PWR14281.1 hypothetical protein DKT69_16920 [Micromonospora sp. 4G51]